MKREIQYKMKITELSSKIKHMEEEISRLKGAVKVLIEDPKVSPSSYLWLC